MKEFLIAAALLSADPALQDELSKAETELVAAQDKVSQLRKNYYTLEITKITESVDAFEKELPELEKDPDKYRDLLHQKLSTLFDQERAQLALIIDKEPDLAAQAQHQLDRILLILTRLNNETRGETQPQTTTSFDRSHW